MEICLPFAKLLTLRNVEICLHLHLWIYKYGPAVLIVGDFPNTFSSKTGEEILYAAT